MGTVIAIIHRVSIVCWSQMESKGGESRPAAADGNFVFLVAI